MQEVLVYLLKNMCYTAYLNTALPSIITTMGWFLGKIIPKPGKFPIKLKLVDPKVNLDPQKKPHRLDIRNNQHFYHGKDVSYGINQKEIDFWINGNGTFHTSIER